MRAVIQIWFRSFKLRSVVVGLDSRVSCLGWYVGIPGDFIYNMKTLDPRKTFGYYGVKSGDLIVHKPHNITETDDYNADWDVIRMNMVADESIKRELERLTEMRARTRELDRPITKNLPNTFRFIHNTPKDVSKQTGEINIPKPTLSDTELPPFW